MEGHDTDDPNDPGGLTRYGIAQTRHPEVDVRSLTLARAKEIYRADYWDPIRGDQLPARLAFVVFDSAVNQGVGRAAGFLQHALGIETDGQIGPRTIAAARRIGSAVVPKFLRLRAIAYFDLARSKPSQQRYLAGWLQRCFEAQQASCELER